MSEISIEYLGNLKTKAVHSLSGVELITDAPPDNNGEGKSFSPTDLLATAIGSCMLTIMGISANTNNIEFDTAKIYVEKVMSSNPRRIGELNIKMELPNSLTDKERTILERAAKQCPVAKSIHPDINENLIIKYTL
ncbi:MAG: osmotically inducible protein OsmC [Candidatus Marinimicrobia bacterium]|nr:osmotically inducible protein OsmC [Candidatus Neomarinimicrobiota bacterium]